MVELVNIHFQWFQPILKKWFAIPVNRSVKRIETCDLLDTMNYYLTSRNLWGELIQEKEFIEFLAEEYKVETIANLGVKISSIPLVIEVCI